MPIWQVLFNILFATDMQSFSTPGRSFFTMFRGLLGDIDVDTLVEAQPTLGPMVFSLYVTMVLFIAFTILIAIISDSHDAVKDVVPEEGTFVSISRKVQEWTALDDHEEPNSQPCFAKLPYSLTRVPSKDTRRSWRRRSTSFASAWLFRFQIQILK